MDMDIDLESSPSTAAPSCCSRCKQQCFQDTTSIALTASHHFLTIFNNNHYIPLHTITYHYIPLLCGHIDLFFVDIGGKLWNKVHRDHPWPSVTLRRCRSYTSFGLNRRNSCWNSRKLCPSMAIWDVRRFLWSKSVRCLYIEISGSVKWRFPKMGVPLNPFDVRIFHSKPAIGDSGISHWNWVQHQVTRHWSLRWNPLWWLSILGCAVCILLGHGFHAAVCQSGPVRIDEPLGHQGPILGQGTVNVPAGSNWVHPASELWVVLLCFTKILLISCGDLHISCHLSAICHWDRMQLRLDVERRARIWWVCCHLLQLGFRHELPTTQLAFVFWSTSTANAKKYPHILSRLP